MGHGHYAEPVAKSRCLRGQLQPPAILFALRDRQRQTDASVGPRLPVELGELVGFKVDLRTAADLSRYFRQEVLEEAVELHAARG